MLKKILFATRKLRYRYTEYKYRKTNFHSNLLKYKGIYKGKTILVVGNGPSLNKTPLSSFNSMPSIGMNKIHMLYDRTDWRPEFVLCMNNLVAKQAAAEWKEHAIPVLASFKCKKYIPANLQNDFDYYYSHYTRDFSDDFSASVGSAGTVTYAALQFAYYTGAQRVIIVGVDHSFKVSANSKANDIEKVTETDQNHFDPNYFAKGQYWGVPNLELSELGYMYAKEMFEKDGREIYDATVDGKLTIFPKLSVAEAISMIE